MDSERTREKKKIVFVREDPIKLESYKRPYKHSHLDPDNTGRVIFLPDYFAPLDEVYANNGYTVEYKTIERAWEEGDTEPFIFLISPQPNLFKLYNEERKQIQSYFNSLSPLLIDAVNDGNCALVIHNCKEEYSGTQQTEAQMIELLSSVGIHAHSNVLFLENSPGVTYSNTLNTVQWNFFETAMRLQDFDIPRKTLFTSPDAKKFLCLNFTPRPHRQQFMYAMQEANLLHEFNASHIDDKLPLVYDTTDHVATDFLKPASGHLPYRVKDVDHWNTLSPRLVTENLLFIVTETAFTNENLLFLTEKTFKPFLLRMPFILIAQRGTLAYLRSIGYRTFSDFWDEDYDSIEDPGKRLQTIIKLTKTLATQDLSSLVSSMTHILEHNYHHLKTRRPETAVFSAINNIWKKKKPTP